MKKVSNMKHPAVFSVLLFLLMLYSAVVVAGVYEYRCVISEALTVHPMDPTQLVETVKVVPMGLAYEKEFSVSRESGNIKGGPLDNSQKLSDEKRVLQVGDEERSFQVMTFYPEDGPIKNGLEHFLQIKEYQTGKLKPFSAYTEFFGVYFVGVCE